MLFVLGCGVREFVADGALGVEAGLDLAQVGDLLTGDAFTAEVRADERRAAQRGIRGADQDPRARPLPDRYLDGDLVKHAARDRIVQAF
ncbi:hypothetical protein [Actinomadura rudentiformis]|uniref:hypothetical protein n=1 Tax=Actinomadura rudentiformis TaxID=359158 RepID=UPI00178C82E8|nr:hypothetical protein [Actinomadura rudentiformis]